MNHTNKTLFTTVFITGAAVLVLEIAAVRILSPIYGSSLHVLSSVLTVILTALSIGYWYGGKLSDKEKTLAHLYNIIIVSGISVLVLLLISKWLLPTLGPGLSTTVGPLFFSIGLFFIPSFLLGTISPFVIKIQSLTTPQENIGSVVGATFFWGTFGSIVGSLATGYLLIPHLGVTRTILLISAALLTLGVVMPIYLGQSLKKNKIISLLLVTIISGGLFFHKGDDLDKYVYAGEGLYSSIHIEDTLFNNEPARVLYRDRNTSAAIYKDSEVVVFPYLRFITFYDTLIENPERVLFLGGGGYTGPRKLSALNPDLKIDVVEIEPVLYDLAQKYLDFKTTPNINNYVMDARVFLQNKTTEPYDLIFSDVFSTNLAPPFHLTTQEFYNQINDNLTPDGILLMNIVSAPIANNQSSIIGSTYKTLKTIFPNIAVYRLGSAPAEKYNFIFIARKSDKTISISDWTMSQTVGYAYQVPLYGINLEKELLLTDDHAPIEYLIEK